MKKNIGFICLTILCFCAFIFAGCTNNGTKEIESVNLTGIKTFYSTEQSIDFENAKLEITYDDESVETISDFEIDVEALNISEGTKYVVYTNGLYAQIGGTLVEGTYVISYASVDKLSEKIELLTITVYNAQNLSYSYDLTSFNYPTFVRDYNLNRTNTTEESKFLASEDVYYVGDDNEFIFKPQFLLESKTETEELNQDSAFLRTSASVYLGNSSTPLDETNEYYTYNPLTYGFQFTEEAVGKTFTIKLLPLDFDKVDGYDAAELSFTVTVADGWNVYSAKDLGRINFYDGDMAARRLKGDNEDTQYHFKSIYGESISGSAEDYNTNKMWRDFLNDQTGSAINGIFLHSNIIVTSNDIPSQYFVSSSENEFAAGSLRDFSFLYYKYMDETDFNFNGNYFTIDLSNLPIQLSNRDFSGKYYTSKDSTPLQSHSKVFCFAGYYSDDELTSRATESAKNKVTIQNVNMVGNMSYEGDYTKANIEGKENLLGTAFSCGGVSGFQALYSQATVNNVNIKNMYMGLYADTSYKGLTVSNTQIYDCFNCAIYSYHADENEISNCILKRFGGPAVFTNSGADGSTGALKYKASFSIDKETVIENYVNGTESWFNLYGASGLVTGIIDINTYYLNSNGINIAIDNKLNLQNVLFSEMMQSVNQIYSTVETENCVPFITSNIDAKFNRFMELYGKFSSASITPEELAEFYEFVPQTTIEDSAALTSVSTAFGKVLGGTAGDSDYAILAQYAPGATYCFTLYNAYTNAYLNGAPLILTSNGGIYYIGLSGIETLLPDNYNTEEGAENLLYIMLPYQATGGMGAYGIVVSYTNI